MEKKVESPTSLAAVAAGVSKESSESGAPSSCSPTSEGLELARMFQQLSVTRPGCHGKWRESSHSSTDKQPLKRLKKYDKFKPEKKLSFRKSSQKFILKPSRLSCLNVTCTDRSSSPKSSLSNPSEQSDNFSEFLNACSREIATIEESEQQKQRKSSTCAQQAREEHDHSAAVNFSIDVLTDYLEETVLLPKKMSYMAELMYT